MKPLGLQVGHSMAWIEAILTMFWQADSNLVHRVMDTEACTGPRYRSTDESCLGGVGMVTVISRSPVAPVATWELFSITATRLAPSLARLNAVEHPITPPPNTMASNDFIIVASRIAC
jgi:hypothetical protein